MGIRIFYLILLALLSASFCDSFAQDDESNYQLVYGTKESGTWEIWKMNSDGTGKEMFLSVGGNGIQDISCSPDGKKIAFSNNTNGIWEIYVADLFTKQKMQVTTDGGLSFGIGNYSPCWIDDQSLLYSTATRNEGQREIFRINLDGTGQEKLTNRVEIGMSYALPSLSFDRKKNRLLEGSTILGCKYIALCC